MPVTNATSFHQSNGHEAAVFARAAGPPMTPDGKEAEPLVQGAARQEPGNEDGTAGQASSGTPAERHGGRCLQDDDAQRLKQARSVLNESADEEAFRLRSGGMTYRAIGEKMGVDQSMAHRRVKRQVMRQKMYLDEKLEEARDFELDKLRQMEQAILPDATAGDHSAIKLVLRIMEMRRKFLKDIPLEHGDAMPSIEDRAEMLAEVVDAEWERKGRPGEEPADDDPYPTEEDRGQKPEVGGSEAAEDLECGDLSPLSFSKPARGGEEVRRPAPFESQSDDKSAQSKDGSEPSVDRETAEAFLARMWQRAAEAVQQKLAEEGVTANDAASTDGSTTKSR